MTAKPLPADYRAALEGIAWYRHHDPGCLSIQGRDQAAFLQRQTTHDVRLLNGDRALPTILTSSNARILDVLYLLPGSEGNILALTLPGQGAATAAYFKKRIFFMDQVAVEDLSAAYTQIDLIGPCREDILQPMGFTRAPTADEILTAEWEGCLVYLLHNSAPLWPGWRLFFPAGISTTIDRVLEQVGATQLTDENYHLLHLENGLPQVQSELIEDYTPLEVGLRAAISDSKGCYTGQEVIARQITYDKVTQQLCGLRLPSLPLEDNSIWYENKPVGRITSTGISPRFGPLGLAILKRPYFEPATRVMVGNPAVGSQEASVTSLPFEL